LYRSLNKLEGFEIEKKYEKRSSRYLLRFDDPDDWEFPKGFNYEIFKEKALKVNSYLIDELNLNTQFEGAESNQDASFCISIIFTDYKIKGVHGLYISSIRFSNFGNLVTLKNRDVLPVDISNLIIQTLQNEKYIYLDEEDLNFPYDGNSKDRYLPESWWIRYFDWL